VTTGKDHWEYLNQQIIDCKKCPRLIKHCQKIAQKKRKSFQDWTYWGKPVPNFGSQRAKLLIVGLAPAAHGANRTGRMFTGDRSGDWLYRALYKSGFANQSVAESLKDGLKLKDCAITAINHCAPPDNKPTRDEITNCEPWLHQTLELVNARVLLALGGIAWTTLVKESNRNSWILDGQNKKFSHGAHIKLTHHRHLLASYHPSQQNTFTGRLTESMLDMIFLKVKKLINY